MINQDMISPENYYDFQKNKTYEELLTEKSKLIEKIEKFECGRYNTDSVIFPSSDVIYQMELLYLAKLCELISKKYNILLNQNNNSFKGTI